MLKESQIDISLVLLTHWHGDHTGGVPHLLSHDPALASRIYKNKPDQNQQPITDGQVFRVQGATLRAVFTPGHAVDHMCFVLHEENALFTGDHVLGHGYSVVLDLSEYMDSLARMATLRCATGYPGHGAKIEDMGAKLGEYIRHKELRVEQVFATLAAARMPGRVPRAGLTVTEIVHSIYGHVPAHIVETALAPFMNQALCKLAEDQRVGFEPGEAKKRRWFATSARLAK